MRYQSILDNFLFATSYTDLNDIKKLRFIFSSINKYLCSKDKEFEMLHVLDIGCGTGGITLPLSSLGCQVTAFDIDENSIKSLQVQANQRKIANLNVAVDNGYTFDNGKLYDIIIASEVFEHVLEPHQLAENIARKMMDGSYLIVTIPNGYGPWELKNCINIRNQLRKWNFLRHLLGKKPYIKGGGADHCQFYTKEKLVKLLSRFSLRLIEFSKSASLLTIFRPHIKSKLIEMIDLKLVDILPYWLSTGWYFVFEMHSSKNSMDSLLLNEKD